MSESNVKLEEDSSTGYTATVYFHGMGEQRRYEEVSRLVDALDAYAHGPERYGTLINIHPRLEVPRGEMPNDVGYIRVVHSLKDVEGNIRRKNHRFYECYWAPVTAGGSPMLDVLKWLARQIWAPLSMLASPWRSRQRVRRAAFHSMWSRLAEHDQSGDIKKILKAYDDFEGQEAIRNFSSGNFDDFVAYLKQKYKSMPETGSRLETLARRWHWFYVRSELFNLFVLLTLTLAIIIGAIAVIVLLLAFLKVSSPQLAGMLASVPGGGVLNDMIVPNWRNASALALVLAGLFGITSFLRNYLGDVQFWTTYEETDIKYLKRRDILSRGFQLLMHVLKDDKCERVVVIAHSLGTAIALDSLLEVSRYNRARNIGHEMESPLPLEKIEHFITMGSPIDKVHYFFESYQGKYHRYIRVVDELRGDIGTPPFAKNRKPHVHWINFWDESDIVSGSIESQTNKKMPELQVDNVHANSYWFPSPGASHSGYFESRLVIGHIFSAIFEGRYRFSQLPVVHGNGRDYESVTLGPGVFNLIPLICQYLMMGLPWLILAGYVLYLLGSSLYHMVISGFLLVAALLGLFWLFSVYKGHRDPLQRRDS